MEVSEDQIDSLITKFVNDPLNLSTEVELREQILCAIKGFHYADADGTGYLTSDEIGRLCEEMGLAMTRDEESLLQSIDKDGSDEIDMQEWLDWWLKRVSRLPNPTKQQEVIARNTFKRFDQDQSGTLDISELSSILESLGAELTEDELSSALMELDSDDSGKIEMNEFVDWWCNRSRKNRQQSLVSMKLRKLAKKASQIYSTDIFTAVWNNRMDLVTAFIESDHRSAIASDSTDYGNGWTPLHYACYRGHTKIVEYLLDQSNVSISAINKGNDHGFTPLFYACQHNHIDICQLLLDRAADPTIVGIDPTLIDDNTELFSCPASFAKYNKELAELLQYHDKCTEPKEIINTRISCQLIQLTKLSVDLPNQRMFSNLPIDSYDICLKSSDESIVDVSELKVTVKANAPSSSQPLDVTIDKKWTLSVLQQLTSSKKSNPNVITVTIVPINCMNMKGPMTEACPVDISSILNEYRQKATKAVATAPPSIHSVRSTVDHDSQNKTRKNSTSSSIMDMKLLDSKEFEGHHSVTASSIASSRK